MNVCLNLNKLRSDQAIRGRGGGETAGLKHSSLAEGHRKPASTRCLLDSPHLHLFGGCVSQARVLYRCRVRVQASRGACLRKGTGAGGVAASRGLGDSHFPTALRRVIGSPVRLPSSLHGHLRPWITQEQRLPQLGKNIKDLDIVFRLGFKHMNTQLRRLVK